MESGRLGIPRCLNPCGACDGPRSQDRLDLRASRGLGAAALAGKTFRNRGLFSDHYLENRFDSRCDRSWAEDPSPAFLAVQDLLKQVQGRFQDSGKPIVLEPLFRRLGFDPVLHRSSETAPTQPDYLLKDASGKTLTAAFVTPWDRWLDGPDVHDVDHPDETPGALVLSALDDGWADWIIVTNGRLWRLYSRCVHARATHSYEVDLVKTLNATDHNEAFRHWWLFFRAEAYRLREGQAGAGCWLDSVLEGSRAYAKRLGARLKERIVVTVFPQLAEGFLSDREERLGKHCGPSDEELAEVFEAALTLLYRLLFLLYAESRELLPVRHAPRASASLKAIQEEIKASAGDRLDEADPNIRRVYSSRDTRLYDRLGDLLDTTPHDSPRSAPASFGTIRESPTVSSPWALDRLSRDQDETTSRLAFVDYKALEVRNLGSIYEGLLELKLRVAQDDLTTQVGKQPGEVHPPSQAMAKRGTVTAPRSWCGRDRSTFIRQ